jgi:hypothetical protein
MGGDVYGRQPTTPQGRYFGTNWSGWHSLVDYCTQIAPELTRQCTHWGSNDGDGLSGPDSQALAARL